MVSIVSKPAPETAETTYDRDQVIKIINSVIQKVEKADDISRESLFTELNTLKNIIVDTRNELRGANAGDISGKHIPTATDELDAVVAATAEATGRIMDSCEVITTVSESIADQGQKDKLVAEVTNIFEACSFQDITGQRITKVINSLKQIELKVNKILEIVSDRIPDANTSSGDEDTRVGDARLLNGPQMADKAVTQADIDKLLADF